MSGRPRRFSLFRRDRVRSLATAPGPTCPPYTPPLRAGPPPVAFVDAMPQWGPRHERSTASLCPLPGSGSGTPFLSGS